MPQYSDLCFSAKSVRLLSLAVLAVMPLATGADDVGMRLGSESYSAIGPIKQLLDDLEGKPLEHGRFAFTHNQAELFYRRGDYELSTFSRYDYYLRFNRDTVDLAYQYKNDLPLDENRLYHVYLNANHIRANGVAGTYYFALNEKLSAKLRMNYIQASEVKDGGIEGHLRSREDSYDADIGLDYAYSEDTLLKRPPESVRGRGYGFDIDLHYRHTENLKIGLEIRDFFTRLDWDDVTYTQARLTSDNVSYDDEGRIQTRPALSGIESYRNQRQRLPLRAELSVDYALQLDRQVYAELFSYDGRVFPRLGVRRDMGGNRVSADVDLRSQALSASWQWSGIEVMLRSNRLDWEKASHLAFSVGYYYRFL